MNIDCCVIAIVLAVGNMLCWFVFFSQFFIRVNAKDKTIEFKATNVKLTCQECKKKKKVEGEDEEHSSHVNHGSKRRN